MTRYKIIVGPAEMYVVRNGVFSGKVLLTHRDGPVQVTKKAADLYETIEKIVAHNVWLKHLIIMSIQRRCVATYSQEYGTSWFSGPSSSLVSTVHWKHAVRGKWFCVPSGIAARLKRLDAT